MKASRIYALLAVLSLAASVVTHSYDLLGWSIFLAWCAVVFAFSMERAAQIEERRKR